MDPKPKKIPVVILAGGLGTRLSEETTARPKPMVEVGGLPILWHIMMTYNHYGFRDFIICAGYKSEVIKDFFSRLSYHRQHVEFRFSENGGSCVSLLSAHSVYGNWTVKIIETGDNCMTGARVAKALEVVGLPDSGHFALTYGDGLTDANLADELEFHVSHNRIGTVLGVYPRARFGLLEFGDDLVVRSFKEKPQAESGFINGGFFFFKNEFTEYLSTNDSCILERAPLERLANDGQLSVFPHKGFWQCMDTLRDKALLEENWASDNCPWGFIKRDR